jgi:hypothetical protein
MARPGRAFYFKLAQALGMTVKELLMRIDSAEITEWMAYFKLCDNPELVKPHQSADDLKTILTGMAGSKK